MKRLTALLLAAALALSLAACGPEGKAADTVRYGLSNAWDALMPYNSPSGSNYSRIIYDKIYDRLAYVHADGTLEPRAASSWESADGGTAALFHLDEKAAFHDGTPVTAEHWTDTIALLTDPACPTLGRSAFAVLSGTDDNRRGGAWGGPGSGGGGQVHPEAHLQDPHHAGGLPAGQEPGVLRSAHPSAGGDSAGGRDGAGAVGRACWLRPLQNSSPRRRGAS